MTEAVNLPMPDRATVLRLAGATAQRLVDSIPTFVAKQSEDWAFAQGKVTDWTEAIGALAAFESAVSEIGDRYMGAVSHGADPNTRAIMLLHARICRSAKEVRLLLSHGFALGAQSSMRTVYEHTVVAAFVEKHRGDTGNRFIDHDVVDHRDQFLRRAEANGQSLAEYLDDDELVAMLNTQCDDAVEKYGKTFLKDYGWADHILNSSGRRGPSFKDLVDDLTETPLHALYRLASNALHSSSYHAQAAASVGDGRISLQSGPSPMDLEIAGIGTPHILLEHAKTLVRDWQRRETPQPGSVAAVVALDDFVGNVTALMHAAEEKTEEAGSQPSANHE